MINEHQSNSGAQSVTALPKAAERDFGGWRIALNIRPPKTGRNPGTGKKRRWDIPRNNNELDIDQAASASFL